MRRITATEARTRFAELLRDSEKGEITAITRHGLDVAHLVPAHTELTFDSSVTIEYLIENHDLYDQVEDTDQEDTNQIEGYRWGNLYAASAIQAVRGSGVVPQNWSADVRMVLLKWEQEGRLPDGTLRDLLASLAEMSPIIDQEPDLDEAMNLALKHRLPLHSALYVELASRRHAVLATQDPHIERAALAEGVDIYAPF